MMEMESGSSTTEAGGSSQESASPVQKQVKPARGRGRPRRKTGMGMRGRGRGRVRGRGTTSNRRTAEGASGQSPSPTTSTENRRRHTESMVNELDEDAVRKLLRKVAEKSPSLLFDIMEERVPAVPVNPIPGPSQSPPWCTCKRCREMPTPRECICCGREEAHCFVLIPHFELLCLDETVLAVARLQRQDILAQDRDADINKANRHAAYRQFIYWQYGRLGEGRRRVIPSCCVWAIRDRFPDANNFYVGFNPGRLDN